MNKYFLVEAVGEAIKGIKKNHGGPFGAVIVKNGKIIARAHNTVLKTKDPTNHAEINAIRKAARRLKSVFLENCSIYSTTEPCPMCFSAIHWARLKSIHYGTDIKTVKKLGFNELPISNKTLKKWGGTSLQIYKEKDGECRNLLEHWKTIVGRKIY